MTMVEDLKKTLVEFPKSTSNVADLARMQQFFKEMKEAGIAQTREYGLPQPDTIGRVAEKPMFNETLKGGYRGLSASSDEICR